MHKIPRAYTRVPLLIRKVGNYALEDVVTNIHSPSHTGFILLMPRAGWPSAALHLCYGGGGGVVKALLAPAMSRNQHDMLLAIAIPDQIS